MTAEVTEADNPSHDPAQEARGRREGSAQSQRYREETGHDSGMVADH